MDNAGKVADLTAAAIEPGFVRLDLLASVPPDHQHEDRYCTILDLHTARAAAILLIRAIEQAEVIEAKSRRKAK